MIPARIQKGDTLGVIAPSDSVTEKNLEEFNNSILLMEGSGYKLKIGKNVFSNSTGYGATAEQKAEDLNKMFAGDEVKMVWCAKGGFNSNSIFDLIDYELIKKNPKILCGYSDTTAIANMIYEKTGLVTFSGQTFKGLSACETEYCYKEIIKRFQDGSLELGTKDDEYKVINLGQAEGIMIGGNLSIMSNLITGKYNVDVTDKILFLEEFWLESPPEAVSSYFYRMKQNDVFSKIKGIWLGGYEHESGITLAQVLKDTIGNEYDFPIIQSDNFGHIDPKTVIPIGVKVRIDTDDEVKIKLLEECVK